MLPHQNRAVRLSLLMLAGLWLAAAAGMGLGLLLTRLGV